MTVATPTPVSSTLTNWEYRVESCPSLEVAQTLLNQLGGEGWELVNVVVPAASDAGPVKTLRARKEGNFQLFLKRNK